MLLKSLPFLDPIFSDARGNLHLLPQVLSSLDSKDIILNLTPHSCPHSFVFCLLFLHLVLTYASQAVFSSLFPEFPTQMILSILHYFSVLVSKFMYPAKTNLHIFSTGTYQSTPPPPILPLSPVRSQTRLWVQSGQERNKVPFPMKLLLQKEQVDNSQANK